jgi:hypothetical protein
LQSEPGVCKPGDWQRPYSRAGVRGLVLAVDETKSLLVIGANLHLVAEPHVVLDVLAGHADIVGDLVDLIASGTGSNSDVIAALLRGCSDSLNQTGQKVVQRNLNMTIIPSGKELTTPDRKI